jgi:molecular chaperone DnaK
MTPVIGIDLGTTNTVVAVVREGQAIAIADETGHTLIPSVVSFAENGDVLVGQAAKAWRSLDPRNTIYSVKRLIGRSADSDEIRKARARFPFEMREGPGQAALVVARGETYTLPEISAFVLRKAKTIAERYLNTAVERAVITVPANFNDLQRAATKVAGRVAGLEVLRILNEPTAAALAYGFGKASSERIAVYDFGGGTFDVTLLDLSDNVFEVLATAGNSFLGGDDIDIAIAERMAGEFFAKHRLDVRENPATLEQLRAGAEHIKQALSFQDEAVVNLEALATGALGKPRGLEFRMTRAEFDLLAQPIVERTFDVCKNALEIAKKTVADFNEILLVGGSTRIPLVRQRVEEFFQRPIQSKISPDEVVAIGAAIQANALTGTERRRGTVPLPPAAARRVPTIAGPGPGIHPRTERPRTDTIPGVAAPGGAPPIRIAPPARVPTGVTVGSTAQQRPDAARPVRDEEPAAAAPKEAPPAMRKQAPPLRREPPPVPREPARPKPATQGARPESVAFTLRDEEIEEILGGAPPPAHDADDETTVRGQSVVLQAPAQPPQPLLTVEAPRRELSAPWQLPKAAPAEVSEADDPWDLPRPSAIPQVAANAPWELPKPTPISAQEVRSVAPPPLLIDVTPLSLWVETVRGFCDALIERNTPVPCEQTREFVTATDAQTAVRIRVAQGESRVFERNTLLGEVELSDLEALPRGAVRVAVTFALDANGMLNVSAKELRSGKATAVELRLVGLPDTREILKMTEKHGARQAV